jgi:hypothetical protein
VRGRARVAAQDELAIHEQRVRRTEGENSAARVRLEQDPGRDDAPAQQVPGACFIENADAGEADRFARTVALDDERASVLDVDDADHAGVDTNGEEDSESEDDSFHCVFCGAEAKRRAPQDAESVEA